MDAAHALPPVIYGLMAEFDDANALLPADEPVPEGLLDLDAIHVTTEPAALAVAALESVNAVVEVGEDTITYRKAQHDEGIELSRADEKLKRMTPPSAVARMAGGPRPAAPGH